MINEKIKSMSVYFKQMERITEILTNSPEQVNFGFSGIVSHSGSEIKQDENGNQIRVINKIKLDSVSLT